MLTCIPQNEYNVVHSKLERFVICGKCEHLDRSCMPTMCSAIWVTLFVRCKMVESWVLCLSFDSLCTTKLSKPPAGTSRMYQTILSKLYTTNFRYPLCSFNNVKVSQVFFFLIICFFMGLLLYKWQSYCHLHSHEISIPPFFQVR